ncbi:MAG: 1-acyl-sn-glycerol-3-phosphate acyltransferase [Candidatus Eremiobacteraeota bacterium]|nr:1-acyl-sn-glycerol-3-phosphate acyltransferase [Candidatus Eremiobacteraeota bacterium]MBV8367013.1 1-acyl-sn-glycerol-3-phosphate acyltransferase [Candidatus Eremiobacteraeota bacterium]
MSLYDLVKAVLRPSTRALFDVKVSGEDNVPSEGGLVVAANHRSYLDPPLLGTWFPRTIHFMAKEELFRIPVLGRGIAAVHAFPVTRDAADIGSVRRALRILKEGGAIGIFPEGTRNVSGDAKHKGGAVLLASSAHCPVVPVGLVRTALATKRLRASHVEVRIGTPMVFQGSARKATKAEIDAWTAQVADAIEKLTSG